MRITTWAEYGVICALHLARRAGEGLVSGREIAEREKLPADYAEQILPVSYTHLTLPTIYSV